MIVTIELSTGLMILIGLVAFWIGFCFIVGMSNANTNAVKQLTETFRKAQEFVNKLKG
jgi:hypothetical protein